MNNTKIITFEQIQSIVENFRREDKSIVQCHGVFDLLHPGHFKHLEAAKKFGDILIVTITADKFVNKGPGRPVFNERLRAESIAKNEDVNYVVISEYPTAVEVITAIKPDIFAKGVDYVDASKDITGGINKERDTVEQYGGRLVITDEIAFSSSHILNQYFDLYPKDTLEYLENFKGKYTAEQIIGMIEIIRNKKILIIGDTIIDTYCYCRSMNKSPKENIIPARYLEEESFAGGVLATANHLANFCNNITLVTCIGGKNDYEDFIRAHLNKNISPMFIYRKDVPTVVKRRYVEPTFITKLFEIVSIDDTSPPLQVVYDTMNFVENNWRKYDIIIVNDFGHGFISNPMASDLSSIALDKFMALNVQTNSANTGFNLATKYNKAGYICMDEPEVRLACQNRYDSIDVIIETLAKRMRCPSFTVTHSKYETISYNEKQGFFKTPVFSSKVVDTMGAGDAVFAITSPLVEIGISMDVVGFVGNLIGALKVQIIGNKSSVEKVVLYRFLNTLMK